jgi:hypothetical protein
MSLGFSFVLLFLLAVIFFAFLQRESLHHCCKECMSRLFCLFVCYGVQESRGAMDGGGGSYIEDGLVEGTTEASIKREYEEE